MIEHLTAGSSATSVRAAAQLLHDFNREYDEPTPAPDVIAGRLGGLVARDQVLVLLGRADGSGEPVGIAVMRLQPSLFSEAHEVYLAELYVVPGRRGHGYGRELITEAMLTARNRGADYAFLVTSEEDRLAQRLYEAAGFRRTEGEGGPLMIAYEKEL